MTARRLVWLAVRSLLHRVRHGRPVNLMPRFVGLATGAQMIKCGCGCAILVKHDGVSSMPLRKTASPCAHLAFLVARRQMLVPLAIVN